MDPRETPDCFSKFEVEYMSTHMLHIQGAHLWAKQMNKWHKTKNLFMKMSVSLSVSSLMRLEATHTPFQRSLQVSECVFFGGGL
jgi:hypothetical protein